MCKLVFVKTKDSTAYQLAISMIKYQENVIAGHSTGITFKDNGGFHIRKAIGKINSFLVKYPDKPRTNEVLGYSRYASIGKINLDNQQPCGIFYDNKKIGYGLHNGTFRNYKGYEKYKSEGVVNKTDSAVLFAIYSRALKMLGDSKKNRILALSFLNTLIKNDSNHNIIIMFKDGQILFSGNKLTYRTNNKDKIGIMTFGLTNFIMDEYIYEVKGFDVLKHQIDSPELDIKADEIENELDELDNFSWGGLT